MNRRVVVNILHVVLFSGVFSVAGAQTLSDKDIKKNVVPIDNPIGKIVQLEPRQFEYKAGDYKYLKLSEGAQYGFMAENMKTVFPELVKERKVSYMFGKNAYRDARVSTIDEAGLIPVLVASIKQQQQEIEQLKAELLQLKKETAGK
ncbi:tail fiber domain-containing protein [Niabella beijingensis]|uniref:tail fiber domain-containing protein n=1 Tax=Niabella beijingensis TaxID=2872700 RepID=UPI001CBCD469|nr:tail fiber domain-containing protein [Niabella beijingensis]MBZ4188359.1 tail fiber domain-containing protein [Niabella beijingensis]